MSGEPGRDRIVFLDGLRGFAALLVVTSHCAAAFYPAVAFGWATGTRHTLSILPIVNLPIQGDFMVCIFYALSGLALSYHTILRRSRGPAVSGLVRRYPRLMVPCLGGIMLSCALLASGLYFNREAAQISRSGWWATRLWFSASWSDALYDATIGIFHRPYSSYDPPLWTMHNELLGSLLVFGVLLVARPRWLRVAAYVVLAGLTFGGYLLAFVGGMAICEAWLAFGDQRRRWVACLIPAGLVGLVLGGFPVVSRSTPMFYRRLIPDSFGLGVNDERITTHVIGALLVLAAVVWVLPLRRPLESRVARFLGRISFSLFILHFLVLSSLGAWLLIELQHTLPYDVNAFVASAVVIAVSIVLAMGFTRAVDAPTLRYTGRAYRAIASRVTRSAGEPTVPQPDATAALRDGSRAAEPS